MATISIQDNMVGPSLDHRLDDTAFRAGPFSFQYIPGKQVLNCGKTKKNVFCHNQILKFDRLKKIQKKIHDC